MRLSILVAIATFFLNGCSTSPRNHASGGNNRAVPQAPYVRISTTDSNLIELQIALRKFIPNRGHGPAIWLAGVSHVGGSNYYAALQKHLDAQSLVLFEGIGDSSGDSSAKESQRPTIRRPDANSAERGAGSLQSAMASSLGLVFQLEAIDYSSPRFRNSDLSVQQLREIMSSGRVEPGQAGAARSFETLLQMMQGDSFFDAILRMVMRFLGGNLKLQALARVALMESIARMDGDPSQLRGLAPELHQLLVVLVQKRNQKVVEDLKVELKSKTRPDSIAVFFGAGHMPDLELQLRRQLKYQPAEDLWLTAFSVNLRRTSVSPAEVEFIRGFVKREIEQLQTQK